MLLIFLAVFTFHALLVAVLDVLNPNTVGVALGAVIFGECTWQLVACAVPLYVAAIVQLSFVALSVFAVSTNVALFALNVAVYVTASFFVTA